jgi:VIT1/CCC1 family predicted Fe2+/Mn2+ transporter
MSANDLPDRGIGAQAAPSAVPIEPADPRERPIGELLKDLADQTTTLVKQEIELARAELTVKGKQAGRGAGLLAGAAVVALLAAGALTAFLIVLLDEFLPLWLAALIVTVLWAIVALVLANTGRAALKQATPPAPQTVETVKEDIQWAKTRTGSDET